jgi:hypothetical protein
MGQGAREAFLGNFGVEIGGLLNMIKAIRLL